MEVTVEISHDDYLEFVKHTLLKKRLKRSIIIASIFIPLWLVFLNYDRPLELLVIGIELVLFILLWAFYIFLVHKFMYYRIKKNIARSESALGKKTYFLIEEGFKEKSEYSETLTKWEGIKKIEETPEFIYVFLDKLVAYIIPKRHLSNETEIRQLIETLESKSRGQ